MTARGDLQFSSSGQIKGLGVERVNSIRYYWPAKSVRFSTVLDSETHAGPQHACRVLRGNGGGCNGGRINRARSSGGTPYQKQQWHHGVRQAVGRGMRERVCLEPRWPALQNSIMRYYYHI